MKSLGAILFAVLAFAHQSYADIRTPLAVIGGHPHAGADFVSRVIGSMDDLIPSEGPVNAMTALASLFDKKGITGTHWFQVLHEDLTAEHESLHVAIAQARATEKVVFLPIGPPRNDICKRMAEAKSLAFVVASGKWGTDLSNAPIPKCKARNIILVAGYDPKTNRLIAATNYGQVVRLAAPAVDISVQEWDESSAAIITRRRTGTFFAAGLVAAELGLLAAKSSASGEVLVDEFFEKSTTRLESLSSQIADGRVLK